MKEGLDFIKRFEGLHDGDLRTPLLEPMRDPVGIYTLGWGAIYDFHGERVSSITAPITPEEADMLLMRDFGRAVSMALSLSEPACLTDARIVALGSFVYNLGAAAYRGSTLRRFVQVGDDERAATEFGRWVFAGGRRLPGLVRRRGAEAMLYLGKGNSG